MDKDERKNSMEKVAEMTYLESQVSSIENDSGHKRNLKERHIQMISIGGVIGTGLFLGTAGALARGGPLGLFLGYAAIASICWAVMISLGEMVSHLPLAGGHITLTQRFLGPSASFTCGWLYWYAWTITIPAELSAASILISYWDTETSPGVYITVCLVVAFTINQGSSRVYGETEFWFASIKVVTIIGLIILGIIITAGGGPTGESIGFQYWRNPGPFQQYDGISGSLGRFLAFWSCLIPAGFAMIGSEVTAIAAAEAKDPHKTVPRSIKAVYIRIILFYLTSTFIIGLLVNPNNPRLLAGTGTAISSPFVIAIQDAGIKVLPSIVNACLLTSAWSAASSQFFTSSRAIHGMALRGHAPKFFARTTTWGVPIYGLGLAFLVSCLAYLSLGSTAATVFGWFLNMTAVTGLSAWSFIAWCYVRFYKGLKVQDISRDSLPYKSPLQPFAAWYALVFSVLVIFFSGWSVFLKGNWDTATFITNYLPIAFAFVFFFGHMLYTKARFVSYEDMDFFSGSTRLLNEQDDVNSYHGVTKTFIQKIISWLRKDS